LEEGRDKMINEAFRKALPSIEAVLRTEKGNVNETFVVQAMYVAFNRGFKVGETHMRIKAISVIERLKQDDN